MMRSKAVLFFILVSAALGASQPKQGHRQEGVTGVSGFDVCADGSRLHLLLGRVDASTAPARLEHLGSGDGGQTWSAASRVDGGGAAPYRAQAGDVAVAAYGKGVLALWTAKGPGPYGSGPLSAAASGDGGRTWKKAPSPSDDGTKFGRRFSDLAVDAAGGLHAVWLDRRDKAQLRYAAAPKLGGKWRAQTVIDPDTCECCWNTVIADGKKIHALYRAKGPRDMAVATLAGSSWKIAVAGDFNWQFNGCPHVGGGLAADKDGKLHTVVWTGKEGAVGVYHVGSGAPVRLGSKDARFADIAATRSGRLAAVWSANDEDGQTVYAALSGDGGRTWGEPKRLSSAEAQAAHPRILPIADGFRVFWLETRGALRDWASAAL
ncbi:MAG: sialidase family protein [Elusimicrobiota bacterium]